MADLPHIAEILDPQEPALWRLEGSFVRDVEEGLVSADALRPADFQHDGDRLAWIAGESVYSSPAFHELIFPTLILP